MWHKFINGEFYVNLKSKEEVDDFLNQCADRGLRWASGDKANAGVMKKYYGDGMLVIYDVYDSINNKRGLLMSALGYTDNKQIIDWSNFMNGEFTKADLKTGDVILRRNGTVEIVNRELGTFICDNGGWSDFDDIKEDLTSGLKHDEWDIIEVRRPQNKCDCCFNVMNSKCGTLIYKRKEVEEMTLAEVCKLLGKEIKIIKG